MVFKTSVFKPILEVVFLNTFIGYSFYGSGIFQSPSPPVRNIEDITMQKAIFDEIHIREKTDNIDENRRDWQTDTRLLAKFVDNLEAGNITNNGLEIVQFAVSRRRASELNSTIIGYRDFKNNSQITYEDYTQPNDELVYSIIPIAGTGILGEPHEVAIESDFVGWWVVDKETNEVVSFDKYTDEEPTVETQLNQGRTVIETLSRFPQVYYDEREYNTFSLSTVVIPSEFIRSGKKYERIVQNFLSNHKPFIVKSSDGRIFVCDISNARLSSPLNTWKSRDYGTITLDFMEIEDYNEFIRE